MPSEKSDHINIVNWFNYFFPELSEDFHHFANERRCSPQEGRILKRMGVKRGVPDFFLAFPTNGKAGLWLELKFGKNKPSKEQLDFGTRKIMRGYEFKIAWGQEQAKEIIRNYLCDYVTGRAGLVQKLGT